MIKITQKGSIKGHSGAIYSMATSNEADTFYTSSGDCYIAGWNWEKQQQQNFSAKLNAAVYTIEFVPELNWLIGGTAAGTVNVIDLNTNKEIRVLQTGKEAIYKVFACIPYQLLFIGTGAGNFFVYNLPDLKHLTTLNFGAGKIRSIEFPGHKHELWVTTGLNRIVVLELPSLTLKAEISTNQDAINIIKFDEQNSRVLAGSRNAHIAYIDLNSYMEQKQIPAHNFAIYDIAFNKELSVYATASRDKSFKLWSIDTDEVLVRVNKESSDGHTNSVNKVLWLNTTTIASGSDDRTVKIWNISLEI